jgi:glycosyltransferase involved in cell wall biosynthesis
MACGTPVLTFNRQGPAETVSNSETGWLVNTDEELVKMAKRIWKEGVSKSMRDASRKNALTCDVKKISKEWINLLETASAL